jgi:hypothetical protein
VDESNSLQVTFFMYVSMSNEHSTQLFVMICLSLAGPSPGR